MPKQTKAKKAQPRRLFEVRRFAEYFLSGGAYFWTGYLIFFACDKGLHTSLWWSKLLSNVAGWTVNYLLQRYWVFADRRQQATPVTIRYAIITLADFVLDYAIVAGLKHLGLTPYLGQFVSSAFFTVWNYAWYRWWVFPAKYVHHHSKALRLRKA